MNIVIVNCFDTYEHRVDLLCKTMLDMSHTVHVMTSDFCHIEKVRRTEIKENYKYFQAQPYYKNMSVRRLCSHYKLAKEIFEYLYRIALEIDVLWVLVPPNSFVREAAKLKKEYPNINLIYDMIDLWPETMPIFSLKKVWPFTIWKNMRDRYLVYADHVALECNLYQKVLEDRLDKSKCTTLYLAREIKECVSVSKAPENQVNLCYLGSINNIIDIPTIEAIVQKILKIKHVELHVIGDGEKRDELITTIESTGATVVYHGKIYDREEKQRILCQCHYGLNVMKKSVCVGLTMKSMDYFEAGLPIINNIKGDTWEFVSRENIGINYENDFLEEIDLDSEEKREQVRNFYENNLSVEVFKKKVMKIIR